MRIQLTALVVTLLTVIAGAQAPTAGVPDRVSAGFRTIDEPRLRADLSFLASDALQGRLSLTIGDQVAIEWVASEFAKAGLAPAFGSSYMQPVPLVEYGNNRAESGVVLTRAGALTTWRFPDAYGAFPRDVDVTADVVFAGFGITVPALGYDDYAGLDAKGKIVLVFDHEPQERDPRSIFNGTGNTRHATTRVKALNAQVHGALAVLLVAEPNRSHPSNQERMARIGGSSSQPIASQSLRDDELQTPVLTVSDTVARELLATAGAAPADLQAAIDRDLKPQSRALADTQVTVRLRNAFTRTGTSFNVGGLLAGSDPALGGETVLVSAHHDHNGTSGSEVYHGADDNGSGTVGVVALARAFAANAARPRRSLLFVVFAAEERGLLGAYYLAAHPVRPLATTRAMINFDMIGRNEEASEQTKGLIEIPADTTNRLNLIGGAYSPEYRDVVEAQNRVIGLVLDDRFDHESALNVFFRSDQFPFVLHDVPALWWFTGFHPDYHHGTDTADRINYRKMADILRLAYLSAWQIGDTDHPPRFVADPRGSGTGSAAAVSHR